MQLFNIRAFLDWWRVGVLGWKENDFLGIDPIGDG
jgi:hypothetical protein